MTDVSAPLPDVILPPGATITVTFDDTSAVIEDLNVYGFTPARQNDDEPASVTPLFSYGATG